MLKDWLYWQIFRRLLRWNTYFRIAVRRQSKRVATTKGSSNIRGLDRAGILYINLNHRDDRRREIESELRKIGVSQAIRVVGIPTPHGGIGNAISHVISLTSTWAKEEELLMVCEDDAEFLLDRAELDQLIEEFASTDYLDVLCLGYASLEKPIPVSASLGVANHIQTTSCYVMKRHAVPILAASAARATYKMTRGIPFAHASFDRVWKVEQQRLLFAIPLNRAVQQRPSFSDVEGRDVSYRA